MVAAHNQIRFGDTHADWTALQREAETELGPATQFATERVVFLVESMREAFAAIIYGLHGVLDFGVIEANRVSNDVAARFAENHIGLIRFAGAARLGAGFAGAAEHQPGRITVLTSGTTGLLKLIPHTWASLNTFERVRSLPQNTWFLPYQIGSYAWFQMVALALFKPGQNMVCGDFTDLAGSFATALRAGQITAISSTPTFWRHVLMSLPYDLIAQAPIRSISMGGEIVDQTILSELATIFPNAAIRHIYASSEVGAAIVVTDGKAGFAASLADPENPRAIGVKVEVGRLYIRSAHANQSDTGGWVDTGDLVELRGDRYIFCGRAGNTMINVGGQKAFPPDIEAYLMAHPVVIWAQVTARRAPLVGNLPVAKVVLSEKTDPAAAERVLTAYCAQGLADYSVPRMWDFLDTVPIRASLKS